MNWLILIIIVIVVLGYFQRQKEQQTQEEMLNDSEYRRSVIKNIVEEEFQNYLTTSTQSIEKHLKNKQKLANEGKSKGVRDINGNIKFEENFIKLLKNDKEEFDSDKDNMFTNLLSLDTLEDVREQVNDIFSSNASTALSQTAYGSK